MSEPNASEYPKLPNRWQAIDVDKIYRSTDDQLVSFSQTQIELGILYDQLGKHLKAIYKGAVPRKRMSEKPVPPMNRPRMNCGLIEKSLLKQTASGFQS